MSECEGSFKMAGYFKQLNTK